MNFEADWAAMVKKKLISMARKKRNILDEQMVGKWVGKSIREP